MEGPAGGLFDCGLFAVDQRHHIPRRSRAGQRKGQSGRAGSNTIDSAILACRTGQPGLNPEALDHRQTPWALLGKPDREGQIALPAGRHELHYPAPRPIAHRFRGNPEV